MKDIFDILKIIAWAIFAGIILVIVFVKSQTLGGKSGGEQASEIINSTAKGFADIIKAARGD